MFLILLVDQKNTVYCRGMCFKQEQKKKARTRILGMKSMKYIKEKP